MPHRPLFVSRCHHFSPVIYFIAFSVSLPPSPSLHCLSSFTCALPPPPPALAARSLFLPRSLIHPAAHRAYEHLARNSPPHNATQFHSPYPPGDFIIRFSVSVSFSLLPFLGRARAAAPFSLSLTLPRTSGISTTIPSARKKEMRGAEGRREEREIERGRETESNRERR